MKSFPLLTPTKAGEAGRGSAGLWKARKTMKPFPDLSTAAWETTMKPVSHIPTATGCSYFLLSLTATTNAEPTPTTGDETMAATQTPPNAAVTRAAERYLEQYGEPMVMNTYLKVAVLALSAVCLTLGALVYKTNKQLADIHPMIFRVSDVGHADVIDYRDLKYKPQEAESKYYLARWATLYFQRNRYTIERD